MADLGSCDPQGVPWFERAVRVCVRAYLADVRREIASGSDVPIVLAAALICAAFLFIIVRLCLGDLPPQVERCLAVGWGFLLAFTFLIALVYVPKALFLFAVKRVSECE